MSKLAQGIGHAADFQTAGVFGAGGILGEIAKGVIGTDVLDSEVIPLAGDQTNMGFVRIDQHAVQYNLLHGVEYTGNFRIEIPVLLNGGGEITAVLGKGTGQIGEVRISAELQGSRVQGEFL